MDKNTKGCCFTQILTKTSCCPAQNYDYIEPFNQRLKKMGKTITKDMICIIQVNLGSLCNQSCIHCHVEASPESKEIMSWEIMEKIIHLIKKNPEADIDITGGAPELHQHIEDFISGCSNYTESITLRSNLTALLQKPKFIEILKNHRVTLICSLPDVSDKNTDYQRGKGVFEKSIRAIRILNDSGYGYELSLHLVHNPTEFVLPELQDIVEEKYKSYLKEEYGIVFNKLLVLNNMPIGRFKKLLNQHGSYNIYMKTLFASFNTSTIEGLMCRNIINIGWDGKIYDCDFNNALNLPLDISLNDIGSLNSLSGRNIITGDHCYGCTAMKGSGCYGSVVK